MIEETLNDQKKSKKRVKRRMEGELEEEVAPRQKSKLAPVWRFKPTEEEK